MNPNPEQDPESQSSFGQRAANLAREAKEGIASAGEKIKDKAGEWKDTASEKISDAGDQVRSTAANLRDKVTDKYHDLRDGASDFYDRASARVRTLGDDGVEFVRENPFSTVLTAFGAGLLIGYALRHR